MARIPMVTRTLKATKAHCMCVDTMREEIVTIDVTVSRTFKSDKELTKAIEKQNLLPEHLRLVQIQGSEVILKKYGMTETEFMNVAKEID